MRILKDILRFAFGIIISVNIIFTLDIIFDGPPSFAIAYIGAFLFLYIEIPFSLILIFVSIYNYVKKKVFWNLFKVEFCLFLGSIASIYLTMHSVSIGSTAIK